MLQLQLQSESMHSDRGIAVADPNILTTCNYFR